MDKKFIFLLGFVVGMLVMFSLLLGHMQRHDALYHTPGSKFTTNGVTPQ